MSTKTIITIARQYGSGGREIGEKVAKRLGIPFYNKDLITLAAKQSGMSPEIFEKDVYKRQVLKPLHMVLLGKNSWMETGLAVLAPVFWLPSASYARLCNEVRYM